MGNDSSNEKDQRPEIAKDDDPKSPKDTRDKWHRAEETLGEAPGGGPDAEKRSRISDG